MKDAVGDAGKSSDEEGSAIEGVVRCELSRRIQNPGTCDPRMSIAGFTLSLGSLLARSQVGRDT